jgi:pimeloyl-ACP methyl ester carboxylesterase
MARPRPRLTIAVAAGAAGAGALLLRRGGAPRPCPSVARYRRPRWTEIDWDAHLHDFAVDGARLRYLDRGEGPTLVLLHGMACCWQWWLECLPELTERFRVLAVDLPGFGDSTPLASGSSIPHQAGAVTALLDDLGIERAAVVGHSMGGLVATQIALDRPELVARLVLVDAGGVPMTERRLSAVLRVLRLAHRSFTRPAVLDLLVSSRAARRLMLRGAMADPDCLSDELAALVVPRLDAPGFADAIAASARAVRTSDPAAIAVPTRLIWGERDLFAPVRTAEDMLRALPDGRLDVLPGIGHSPMVEAPGPFTRLLIKHAEPTG